MKKHYIFLFFFVLIHTAAKAGYVWHQLATVGSNGVRMGAFGFSIGSYGYIGGGYRSGYLNDFWQYDPVLNTWTQKTNVPIAISATSTFVINNQAYVIGGGTSFGPFNSTLFMYDPSTNTWNVKASYPGHPMYGCAAFAIGTKGYFGIGNGGASTGPYYTEFYEYDSGTNTWTQKASFPGASRYGTYGIAYNGLGYVGFGLDENIGFYKDWYKYDPSTNTWTALTNFPGLARHYVGGFTINNYIYVGSGNLTPGQGTAARDFYQYDPVGDSWTQMQDFQGGRRWIVASFSIGNIGYFGTGTDSTSTSRSDFWEYILSTLLPVEFLAVHAKVNGNTIDIDWRTASEVNNNYFTVERSADGTTFTPITEVPGAGTTTAEHNYKATDKNPLNGFAAYRVKQTDFNGTCAYSSLVGVNANAAPPQVVYISRVSEEEYIRYLINSPDAVNIIVYDMLGNVIASKNAAGASGTLSLQGVTSGIYIMHAFNCFSSFDQRFVY